jgi:hypothetical protein
MITGQSRVDEASHVHEVGPAAAAAVLTVGIGVAVTTIMAAVAATVRADDGSSGIATCRSERGAAALVAAANGAFLALLIPGVALCRGWPHGSGGTECSPARGWCAIATYGALLLAGAVGLVTPAVAAVVFSMGDCAAGAVRGTALAAIAVAWCTLTGGVAAAIAFFCRTVKAVRVDFAPL